MPAIFGFLYIIFILTVISNGKKRRDAANAGRKPLPKTAAKIPEPYDEDLTIAQESHQTVPLEAHMHTTDMGMEGYGSEGTDCCHDYMLRPQDEQKDREDLYAEEPETETSVFTMFSDSEEEQAQALLQGVIFSEILRRRPPMGRMPLSRKSE